MAYGDSMCLERMLYLLDGPRNLILSTDVGSTNRKTRNHHCIKRSDNMNKVRIIESFSDIAASRTRLSLWDSV